MARMMLDGDMIRSATGEVSKGSALRAVCWAELSARLNAAHDLRRELRQDSCLITGSFGDAAAGYFARQDEGKRAVNHDALREGKVEPCIEDRVERTAATGDRER